MAISSGIIGKGVMMGDLNVITLFSLAAIVMIGMPHGALDGAVAVALGWGKRWQDISRFAAGYILIAALVTALWFAAPIFSLTMFMLISMVHFGLGDQNADQNANHNTTRKLLKYIQVICHGGLVVVVIPYAHPGETSRVFMILTGATSPDGLFMLDLVLRILGIIMLASSLAYLAFAIRMPMVRGRLLEFIGLALLLMLVPPLAGFALYFCAVHTMRHVKTIISTIKAYDRASRILPLTAVFTVMTWVIGAVILALTPQTMAITDALLRLTFIGLAALTVPHMMLVDGLFRPRFLTSSQLSNPSSIDIKRDPS